MKLPPETADTIRWTALRNWGPWAVAVGALALTLVFAQIAIPMTEPQPSAAQQIGEAAGEIRRSAWRSFLGISKPAPDPVVAPNRTLVYLGLVAPVLGIVAVVLALVSGLRRENWRYAAYGVTLGGSAIVFQFVWWLALVVLCVMLLVAIIENMGDIFG